MSPDCLSAIFKIRKAEVVLLLFAKVNHKAMRYGNYWVGMGINEPRIIIRLVELHNHNRSDNDAGGALNGSKPLVLRFLSVNSLCVESN